MYNSHCLQKGIWINYFNIQLELLGKSLFLLLFFFLSTQTGSSQCTGTFLDTDNDGICNALDQCPNFDDDIDIDEDGIPYCQDNCIDVNENGVCDDLDTEAITKKLKIHFSLKRGFYDHAIQVTLVPSRPNTSIHYTLGTNPSCPTKESGTLYSGPIEISNQEDLQTLKAIGTNGSEYTKVYTHSYLFNGFKLPTVVFSCSPYDVAPGEREKPISFEFIVPSNSPLKSIQEYAGTRTSSGGLHSGRSDKVYFRSAYGAGTLKEHLFSDFYYGPKKPVKKIDQLFLRSEHSDDSMIRQIIAHDALRATGSYSPAGRFVYFYKKGEIDAIRHLQERPESGFMEAQTGYDKSVFEAYAGNIHADTYSKIRSGWEATRKAINIESLSNFLLNQWIANVSDFYHYKNYRAAGPTDLNKADGKDLAWHFFNWDMDLGYKGNTSSNDFKSPRNILGSVREHVEFRLRFADIINCALENGGPLTAERFQNRISERSDELALFLANYNQLNINTNNFLTKAGEFIPARIEWLKNEFKAKKFSPNLEELTFSLEEGIISSGQQLTLSNPNNIGSIYYTLDGSDVRTEAGILKPTAFLYQGPITLNTGAYSIFARVYNSSAEDMLNKWSATCGAKTYSTEQTYNDIVINEIHYSPMSSINGQDTLAGKNFEFIELKNIGNFPVDLKGSRFSKGVTLTIENTLIIPPNGFAVFAEDAAAFQSTYGFAPDGVYAGKLNNNGEKINLKDPLGYFIDTVRYDNKNLWDEGTDSTGFSLELLHASLDNTAPLHWFRSDNIGGTPKAENSRTCARSDAHIVINEINYNSNKEQRKAGDWVELHNPTTTSIDLSGWTLYDTGNEFILPQGIILEAEEYIVLVADEKDFTTAFPTVNSNKIIGEIPFGLSNKGERITLFDSNKCLADYVIYDDKLPWPKTPDGDGPSLSLVNPAFDNALPASWKSSLEMNASFVNGSPSVSNICTPGKSCNDENPCTSNDTLDADCNCIGTPQTTDSDNDGVCDLADICDGLDDKLVGTPCEDGNECTIGERYDTNCNCTGGRIEDDDNDGICNTLDDCDNNLTDTTCDDGDPCTTGETYDNNCNCTGGIILDSDMDGICDEKDICNNLDDKLIGQLCSDNNPLTENDIYDASTCSCSGTIVAEEASEIIDSCATLEGDKDEDGICNLNDNCPNTSNPSQEDTNGDNIGDACEQQGILYEACGYSFLHKGLIITTSGTKDAHLTITDLSANQRIFICYPWSGKNCDNELIIQLEQGKNYEVKIRRLRTSCDSRDTISTPNALIGPSLNSSIKQEQILSSIQKKPKNYQAITYPNPVTQVLTIDIDIYKDKQGILRLINSIGQAVAVLAIKNSYKSYQIDVTNLNSGLYFLQILIDGEVKETKKVVVEKG